MAKLFLLLLLVATVLDSSFGAVCGNPAQYAGKSLCDHWGGYCGECVSFYKVCSGDKRVTGAWKRGSKVRGSNLQFGTGIATFPNGRYSGHVAIYVGQDSRGIRVWDQWKGKAVSQRTISFGDRGLVNDGNNYYVIQ